MKFLGDPVAWVWFAMLVGAVILFVRRRWKWAGVVSGFVVLLWVMEVAEVPARLLAGLEGPYLYDEEKAIERSDAVVVLGGYLQPFPESYARVVFNDSADRLITGITLVRDGKGRALVLGGGGQSAEPDVKAQNVDFQESEAAKAWVDSWKFVTTPVEFLGVCANTHDEALRTAALAKKKAWQRVTLVTSAWHLRRAVATFQKAGLEVVPVGCDFQGSAALQRRGVSFVPSTTSLVLFKLWLEERLGYWYYKLRGWA